jgi:hypothetical protein
VAMTRKEAIESLARTIRLYPEYAAGEILGMGMDWDGKELYNKHANDLEQRLADCERMVEKLVSEERHLERIKRWKEVSDEKIVCNKVCANTRD